MDKNDEALQQARIDLTAILRWADRLGLSEGICNHFSLVVPGTTDRFLLNPQGIHWSELRASDLLIVDPDGHVVIQPFCTHEGNLRDAEWLYDHYVDQAVYSMLKGEWNSEQNAVVPWPG